MEIPIRTLLPGLLAFGLAACGDSSGPSSETQAVILASISGAAGTGLFRVDPTFSSLAPVLAEPGTTYHNLRPNPAGSLILFNRFTGGTFPGPVYQVTRSGDGLAPLPGLGDTPAWAPDGSRIAWLVPDYPGTTIVLTDTTGGHRSPSPWPRP